MFKVSTRPLKILDFDIENRPLSYWYDGNPTAEVTAIAWSWIDEDVIAVEALEPPPLHDYSMTYMLARFRHAYDEADVVTGHYIKKHDLPIVNAALIENALPPLTAKLASDTKLDLVKRGSISVSQESLSDLLHLDAPKESMSQAQWREANRLTPNGIAETKRRVVGDVRQHKQMRAALIREELLKTPTMWTP